MIDGLLRKNPGERLGAVETDQLLRRVAASAAAKPVSSDSAPTAALSVDSATEPTPAEPDAPAPEAAPAESVVAEPSAEFASVRARPRRAACHFRVSAVSPSAGRGARRGRAGRDRGRGHRSGACPHQLTAAPDGFASRRHTLKHVVANPGPGNGAIPAGFYRFTNSTGFSIGVPDGWQISHAGHYVYITDSNNGGIFLLIDQSDNPKPDPLADWEQQQANRESSYPDYHLIRLESVNYPQAEKAADWEFTYDQDCHAGARPEQEHPGQRPPRVRALLVHSGKRLERLLPLFPGLRGHVPPRPGVIARPADKSRSA